MGILRGLASLILELAIIAGLLYLLVVVNITQRLEDPELYHAAFTETDAYGRIYDEVLVDAEFQDQSLDLLGGVGLETRQAVGVLRDVMPPAYLQEQTEANVNRFTGFLSNDRETLDLYLELQEPLDRVEAVVVDRAVQVITELEIEEPSTATLECTADSVESLADDLAGEFAGLSAGQIPESVPSLESLDEDCRRQEFDNWIGQVVSSPELDSETARIVEDERGDLRESFIEGDTRAFLEKAAAPLIGPVIDDSLEALRQDLQIDDRLDLLDVVADSFDNITRPDIDREAASLRDTLSAASGPGRIVAFLVVIVGSLLLAAIHVPNLTSMLRWPGLTLIFGGGASLVTGFVLNSLIPGWFIVFVSNSSSDSTTAFINLAADLVESLARQFTGGFIPGAVIVLVIGAVLFGASYFADRLRTVAGGAPSGSGTNDQG
ncbi:MAG: hypothetical protein OXC55_01100 [Chloroflexi bacterium]|nr:hypothetical protein [Chloroflexota bacterium]